MLARPARLVMSFDKGPPHKTCCSRIRTAACVIVAGVDEGVLPNFVREQIVIGRDTLRGHSGSRLLFILVEGLLQA